MSDKNLDKKAYNQVTPAAGVASYEEVKQDHRFYFNIVAKRKIWYFISLAVIIPGIISLFIQGLNFGIDFTGGSMLDIRFDKQITQSKVSKALDTAGLTGQVQLSNQNTEVIIRTEVLTEEQRNSLIFEIEKQVGTFDRANMQEDLVGPAIGDELKTGTLLASALAVALILLYVGIRFQFIFAVSGVLALIHDVLVMLGIFSIFQWQVDLTFIAAILTIFGYSINDTVVIFDRIRENDKRMKKKDSFEEMVDKSVWQTMGRSIKTAGTVIIALLCIFILGGESTKIFALAMLIGVFSGAYSSIFVASQLVVDLKIRFGNKHPSPRNAEV